MKPVLALRNRGGQFATSLLIVTIFVAGFALGSHYSVGSAQSQFTAPPEAEEDFAAFWQVYNLIQNDYVDPEGDTIDRQVLVDGAIKGMIEALDDQFSGYMSAEEYPLINQELEGEIEGIGVVIRTIEETGEVEVVSVMTDTPAMDAGILAGDIFWEVDGEPVVEMTQTELAQKVRGPEGTVVAITMKRGDEFVDFNVTRERIIIPMIESRMLEENIGYVRLNQFGPQARADMDSAINTLNAQPMDGLILDLRGNPGGLLSTAVEVGSAFMADGTVLVEDFGDYEQTFEVNGTFNGLDVPLVVLVDEASASASELVAGALQDNDRATIIGETTFGKGTVQTWQQLVNGGGIRLTIARWLTPDGNWIHEHGITPDIVVEWNPTTAEEAEDDIQIDAAIEYLTSGSVAVQSEAGL